MVPLIPHIGGRPVVMLILSIGIDKNAHQHAVGGKPSVDDGAVDRA